MKRLFYILLAICCTSTLSAQTSISSIALRSNARGTLMNRDLMSVAEMGQFSQSTFQYGTARSMAMAGAMTSLGGDASAMMINPAGLGMYRTGEIAFTPMVTVQSADTSGATYQDSGDTSFSMSNLSAVFNVRESATAPVMSVNFGFGYNKVANLNYSYSLQSSGNSSSISNLFSRQLTGGGVTLSELYGSDNPNWNSLSTALWGAALGYKSGLTFQSYGSEPSGYDSDATGETITSLSYPIWDSTWIDNDAQVTQYLDVISEGSIGEYDLALGGNVLNKFYFGFTFGIQSIYQRLDLLYSEEYTNPSTSSLENKLVYANYNQAIISSGVGLNLKFGLTYRPIEALRIGFAYHTPTWYSLTRQYQASMASASMLSGSSSLTYISADSPVLEDLGSDVWRFRSPSRILIGGSYILASRALISVDYQRDNYGSMRATNLPYSVDAEIYNCFDDCYQAVNTLRMGGEVKFSPKLALRGGYGFSSSMVRDNIDPALLLDTSTTDHINYYSAGIGYSPSRDMRIDLTYMNQRTTTTNYTLFYGVGDPDTSSTVAGSDAIPSAESAQSGTFNTLFKAHNIALSMIFRL